MVFYKRNAHYYSFLMRLLSFFCVIVVFDISPFKDNNLVVGLSYEISDYSHHIIEFVPLKDYPASGSVDRSSNTPQEYTNRNRTLLIVSNMSNSVVSTKSNNTVVSYQNVEKENDTVAMKNDKEIPRNRLLSREKILRFSMTLRRNLVVRNQTNLTYEAMRATEGQKHFFVPGMFATLRTNILNNLILGNQSFYSKKGLTNSRNDKKRFLSIGAESTFDRNKRITKAASSKLRISNATNINRSIDNTTISKNQNTTRPTNTKHLRKDVKVYQKFVKEQRRNYKLYELSKTKNLTITCPEVNNTTFTNAAPFNVLGVPQCGDKVKPKFRLYLPVNDDIKINASECELIPMHLPNKNTTSCFKQLEERKDVGKVVLIIHGFLNGFNTDWMHEMQRDIQKIDSIKTKVAVIVIGWGGGIWDILNYWRVAGNTRYIAHSMFLIIKEMHKAVKSRKLYVHCIGHSLGGQACGLSGKQLIQEGGDKFKYNRISGMDPAGPLFCEDVPYPFDYKYIDPRARIGPNDAHFVDVIHTDGGARYLQFIPQYGSMMALGTVDFYPGETPYYGCYQPGCYDHLIDVESCSHSRSHLLYSTSITQSICLASAKCNGDPHHIPHNCTPLTHNIHENDINATFNKTEFNESETLFNYSPVAMGYWIDLSLTGLYTVNVTGSEPYCTAFL